MITLSLLFTLLGFLSCYHSSEKAKFKIKYPAQNWLKSHPKKANYLGVLVMLIGLSLCVLSLGWLTGIISFLMILTLVASLSILFMPLGFVSVKLWGVFFLILLVIEIFII